MPQRTLSQGQRWAVLSGTSDRWYRVPHSALAEDGDGDREVVLKINRLYISMVLIVIFHEHARASRSEPG